MNTFSLTPLLRNSVGFDRLNDLFESLATGEEISMGYPPYNIEKHGEDRYGITMAVAGFTADDLTITSERDRLTVSGRIASEGDKAEYLYRGIAMRPFQREFRLADYMKVTGADIRDGLLRIEVVREVPEEQKPRTIAINSGQPQKVLEHSSGGKKKAA